jgi:hypothetical protein
MAPPTERSNRDPRRSGVGPNDAEVVRVFTKEPGGTISDETLSVSAGFDVAVEAEAGSAIHGSQAGFETNIVVRDISANDNIAATPAGGVSGQTAGAAWPNQAQTFAFTVASAALAGRENHIGQVLAYLRVGQDSSFETSPLFMLTK